jgi:hypothetical protein
MTNLAGRAYDKKGCLNHQRKAELYYASNVDAATIIAADRERYAGVMQQWAQLVLSPPAERTTPPTRRTA